MVYTTREGHNFAADNLLISINYYCTAIASQGDTPRTGNLGRGEKGLNISQLVVDHESQHTHLCSTALVELDGTLLELGLLIKGVPAEVKGVIAEVTREFSSSDVLHDKQFKEANEGKDLKSTGNRDVEGGIPSVSKIGELGSRVVNVSWKVDSGSIGQVSDNSQHADTSVLDLNITETVKLFLVSISNKAKRVEEAKRSLGTKFILKRHAQGTGAGGILGRSEGSSRGNKGGKDGKLHFDDLMNFFLYFSSKDCECAS
jgi:hypothetical protein